MWVPMHRQPSFVNRKRRRVEEPLDPAFQAEPSVDRLQGQNVVLSKMEIGHCSIQGYRADMEDEFIIDSLNVNGHVIVAIMDGHAGNYSAIFTKENLKRVIEATTQWKKYSELKEAARSKHTDLISQALVQAYVNLDDELRSSAVEHESGCTAVCSIITPTHIVCANVGDSRCVVGTDKATISLTDDHKPSNPEEKARIEAAGGFVFMDRVNGELAMSRAIGDYRYKEVPDQTNRQYKVICYPDVAVHVRGKGDKVMILACDGVWDVSTNEEAVSFVCDVLLAPADGEEEEPISSEEAAEGLIDKAFNDGSTDNISAIVVKF